jgi:hypothetical protein
MAVMFEGMAGVFLRRGPFALDVNYALYNSSPRDGTSTVHEAGAKLWFDVATLWSRPEDKSPFLLRSYAALYWETYDEKGTRDGYWELGLEPAWRLSWAERQCSVSIPIQFGMSARDYYFNPRGADQLLGYASVGLAASISLPSPIWGGKWFLSSSIFYTRLAADNLITINNGNANVFTGKIGVGFSF